MSAYSFQWLQTAPQIKTLVYEASGRRLNVELLSSTDARFDWVGCERDLDQWTDPADEAISTDECALIRSRLKEWSHQRSIRIGFELTADRKEKIKAMIADGWAAEPQAAPEVKSSATRGVGLAAKLWAWFWRTDIGPG